MSGTITRRELVATAAAGAATLAATGPALAKSAPVPEAWDMEADVVVVGLGGAGSVAAITAADEGAEVIVLEKQAKDTDEQISQTASTRLSRSACMNFHDVAGAIDFLTVASRGATPDDVIAEWAEYAVSTKDWLEEIGGTMEDMSETNSSEYQYDVFPQGQNYTPYNHAGFGEGLWTTLMDAVEERSQIQVVFEAPAEHLIADESGAIVGVAAQSVGGPISVKARKGVILACGGFEFDFDMLKQYIWVSPCRFIANPGNTGDGIRMAQEVQADMWHMPLIGGWPVAFVDELGVGYTGNFYAPDVRVDKFGRRFCRMPVQNNNFVAGALPGHMASYAQFYWDYDACDFPAVPCWSITDQSMIDRGPLLDSSVFDLTLEYVWSADNSAEIEKGWILKGDTLDDLAAAIAADPENGGRMDAETLKATVEAFNQYCADGVDPEFGTVGRGLTPLAGEGPYYAVKLYPGCFNTFGGPRRTTGGRIVDVTGEVIPGLYGAGELGSIMGFLYAGGGWNICEVVTSGQIAGKDAASR